MMTLLQDLQFALRQLRRSPAFALIAISTLALAIGVSTAVFSVLDATVIRPLPYNEPDRIVRLQTYSPQGYGQPASWPQYLDWRHNNVTLTDLAGYSDSSANLESNSGATPIKTVDVTDNFFNVFAVRPLLGRGFLPGEDQPGHNDVAVLPYGLWQQTFGGDKNIVGTTIRIDGTPTTVVGVMPAGFRYPLSLSDAVYRPFHLTQQRMNSRGSHFMPTVGRMKPGVTAEQAQADMNHVFQNLRGMSDDDAGRRAVMVPLSTYVLGKTVAPLRVLTGAVFGVLLIGCVNVAGLLLARGVRRQREMGLRSAIGAGRGRLVRQLLTESAVLSLTGAAAGILVAAALLQILRQLLVHSLSRGADVTLNLPVLAATILTALITGLVAGVLPALQSSRISPALTLRSGGSAGSSRSQNRLRGTLIATQIAIALGLLVCSSILLRNLHNLRTTTLGFSPDNMLTEGVFLTPANYAGRDMVTSFYNPVLDRIRAIPGVVSASAINLLPVQESGSNSDISIVGKPLPPKNQESLAENRVVLPGAYETFGAKLLEGRSHSPALDRPDTPLTATVNQAFQRKFFSPGEHAVGHQILWGDAKVEIIGLYSDIRQELTRPALAEMDITPTQIPEAFKIESLSRMNLIIRTTGDPASYAGAVRQAMHEVDATVPFRAPLTMNQIVADTLTFERLESWLFGIFAALALLLSLVGIYGMVHHEVELRTRDIGVRMALGSTRGRIVRGILARTATLMAVGLACGWILTLALHSVLAAVIELQPGRDAALLIALTLTLAIFGMAASLLPARRAASIEPTQALRND